MSVRTIERWLRHGLEDGRKGAPKTVVRKLSDDERDEIVTLACSKLYRNLTPHEIVPLLAEKGTYIASESTFYRVLRERGLVKQRQTLRREAPQEPAELKATAINQIWSWDISYLKTTINGRFFYLYCFVDIFSRAIMGWAVHEAEDGKLAAELVSELCERWGVTDLLLRSDNGGPMRSHHILSTLRMFGVVPSFSRPSVSNDNPFSESLFKTLKYTAGYPGRFQSLEQAHSWMSRFVDWYNNEHRHSGIMHVTPMQRHTGADKELLARRATTYERARMRNPLRWSREPKTWLRPQEVFLRRANAKRSAKIFAA